MMDNSNRRIQRKENKFPMKDFCACHVRPVYLFFLYYCRKHAVNFLAFPEQTFLQVHVHISLFIFSLLLFFLFASLFSCFSPIFHSVLLSFPHFLFNLLSVQPSILFNHSMFLLKFFSSFFPTGFDFFLPF